MKANIATGFYSISPLPIGQYEVSAELTGFRRHVEQNIVLTTGQALELNMRLEVGVMTETVTVEASGSLLETRSSDASPLIESKSIEGSEFRSARPHLPGPRVRHHQLRPAGKTSATRVAADLLTTPSTGGWRCRDPGESPVSENRCAAQRQTCAACAHAARLQRSKPAGCRSTICSSRGSKKVTRF